MLRSEEDDDAESVDIFKLIHAKYAVAIHFGTFQLTNETYTAPVTDLEHSLTAAHISNKRFQVLDVG